MPQPLIARADARPPFFAGVDIGGTNIKVGILDDQGRTLAYDKMPTETARGPDDACQRMAQMVRQLTARAGLADRDVAYVGLGTPGTMDIPAGMLIEPPNLPGWEQFPIRDRLSQYCGHPVAFSNDAGAAAYGEYWQGSGRGMDNMALLTLGTGVGGGILINGASIDGVHSHGAECGHIIIDMHDNARLCPCGQPGHLEGYVGGTAIIKRIREGLNAERQSSIAERVAKGEELTPLLLAQEAERGDEFALWIVLETARYLGIGVVTIMHMLDPAAVIIGGAMTFGGNDWEVGRKFLARVQEEVHRRAFPVPAARTKIAYAVLGGDAGYIGAAGIGRHAYHHPKIT